jgi:hypothetical protein
MAGRPARFGMLMPPPAAVAETRATSYRDVGWLVGGPMETLSPQQVGPGWVFDSTPQFTPQVPGPPNNPKAFRVAQQMIGLYSDPPEMPIGLSLFRLQAIVRKAPQQYGTDAFALGHYSPFRMPRPTGTAPGSPPLLSEMQNSAFQPISRGGKVLVSITESNAEGGPGAAGRRFANTRFGLWFKAWVVSVGGNLPLGSRQTPSPQFRGVMPNYGYTTLPQIIGQ